MDDLAIGQKLRRYRLEKSMSQKQVAEAAEISVSLLSQIERGCVTPSINSLRTISKAIDIPLYHFFVGEEKTSNPVVRADERRLLGQMNYSDTVYELLTPDTTGNIEFCLMKIPPHCETAEKAQSHHTEEVAYILEGNVAIELNAERHWLEKGDSVRIEPYQIHKWINESDGNVSVIFAVSPPSF